MKLSEVVSKIIDLSNKVLDYYNRELPKWHPTYPFVREGEMSPPPPPEKAELESFLSSLSAEQLFQLRLLRTLGRHECGPDELADRYAELLQSDPKYIVLELARDLVLGEYLQDGLEVLREHSLDVDRMPIQKVLVPTR